MTIEIIKFEETDRWNNIVKSFQQYDVYYLNEYVHAFYLHGDGIPELIYFEHDQLRAMNVVMKRDIADHKNFPDLPKSTYFDYSSPYGYGGFLLEGNFTEEDFKFLDKEYIDACVNRNIVSEFVRFHPILKNYEMLNEIYDIEELGNTVSISLDDKTEIWNRMNKKNRNSIRKAINSGVKIYWGRNQELFKNFIDMYNNTMDKDNADEYYYFKDTFYESVLNDLKDHSIMFYAVLNEKVIAMSIIMHCNKQLHYHLSASDREYLKYAPTNLLLYEAACWGCENGYESLHLGGGLGAKHDGLYKFKKSFTKEEDTNFYIGKKIFNYVTYTELCKIHKNESERNEYFPKYRLNY